MIPLLASLDALANTLKTIAGIGGLIFVHELGHFLVGRACGVCAEAFSIGFGPVLAKWKPGETEYRISAIPLGGYVKFLGENPDERGELSPRSFLVATYPRKVAIMLAGVTMNVIAAFTLFFVAFSSGVELAAPVIGSVSPNSPAAAAGLQPGDRVLEVDGHRILSFDDIPQETMFRKTVDVVVERDGKTLPSAQVETRIGWNGLRGIGIGASVAPGALAVEEGSDAFGAGFRTGDIVAAVGETPVRTVAEALRAHHAARPAKTVRWTVTRSEGSATTSVTADLPTETWRIGIMPDSTRLLPLPESAADVAGLREGDTPVSVGDTPTPSASAFIRSVSKAASGARAVVRRDGSDVSIELSDGLRARAQEIIRAAPSGAVVISPPGDDDASTHSPARDAGLVTGCAVVAVNGLPIKEFADIDVSVRAAGAAGRPVKLTWRTPSGELREDVEITPTLESNAAVVGVAEMQLFETIRAKGAVDALGLGVDRTHRWVMRIFGTLRSLVSGSVSAKHLQGPIGIARAGYSTAKTGTTTFFLFLGIISMNLAVLNVLPIPLLDGGQLALITIAKVRGKPLPERVENFVQLAALVLLLGFMAFVIVNDIRNLL